MNDAFVDGINAAKTDSSHVPIVVHFSDGQASFGEKDRSKIRTNVLRANQNVGASIFAIAFGKHADYPLLLGLAEDNGGKAVLVHEGYGNADSQISNFVAQNIGTVVLSKIKTTFCRGDGACTNGRRRLLDSSPRHKLLTDHALADSTAQSFPVLEEGSELLVRGRVPADSMDVSQTLTVSVSADSAAGTVAQSTSTVLQSSQSTLPSGSGARAFALARIAELADIYTAQVATADSRAQETRNAALQLALSNNILWPGLTTLVITKSCSASVSFDSTANMPTCRDNDNSQHSEDKDGEEEGGEEAGSTMSIGVSSNDDTLSNKTATTRRKSSASGLRAFSGIHVVLMCCVAAMFAAFI